MPKTTQTWNEKRMGMKNRDGRDIENAAPTLKARSESVATLLAAVRRTAEWAGLAETDSRGGRNDENEVPVPVVKSETGEELITTAFLATESGLGVSFFRRMVGNGSLCPVGGRPYRFTQEEVLRFLGSKEGKEAVLDFLAR